MPTKVVLFSNMAISDLQAPSRPEKGLFFFFKHGQEIYSLHFHLTVLTDYIIL